MILIPPLLNPTLYIKPLLIPKDIPIIRQLRSKSEVSMVIILVTADVIDTKNGPKRITVNESGDGRSKNNSRWLS